MKERPSSNPFRGVLHTLAALFSNSREFHHKWETYRSTGKKNIEGRWQGEWISEANGHHGRLKGILAKSASDRYQASFHATYAKFLRVCYTVILDACEEDGRIRLEGDADLGRLAGGVYHYEGEATIHDFNCAYRCEYDHGTFRMNRLD